MKETWSCPRCWTCQRWKWNICWFHSGTSCSVKEESFQGKKKRDHWINSMNFMNVNLIFFLISQWEISPRFSLSILCQLLILCFFCNSFISPTPGCLCGLLYFPVMLKVMRTHTQWIAKQTMWSAEQLHITVTGSIYAAHLHSMKASFFGHKRLMRLESSRFRDRMKSLMK